MVVVSFVVTADTAAVPCDPRLGGDRYSEQFLLVGGAAEEVDRTIVVPEGIALGINNLEVTDPHDERVLGAVGFDVGGGGISPTVRPPQSTLPLAGPHV